MNTLMTSQNTKIDWVGNIPSYWEMKKGKYLFSNKKEINSKYQCDNLLSLTLFGVLNKDMESSEGLRPLNYTTYQVFEKNDMVFKLIDLENKKTSRVGLVHERGIMSPVYIRLIPKENSLPRYYYYQFYDLYKKYIFNYLGSGVRSSLTPTDLMEIPLVFPPLPEQTQIVSFLDTKTQKIDDLIHKTEKKIELLKEKRTSLINHCVTKGLNPNVEMKDSGVEWIGEIPREWEFIPLKHICYMKGRIGWKGLKQDEFLDDGDYYLITGHDIKNDRVDWNKCYHISKERYDESPEIMLEEQDLLFTKDGTIGKTLLIENLPKPTSLNSHLLVIRPTNNRYKSKFLQYVFKSVPFLMYVEHNKTGTTFYGVSQNTMVNFRGIFPPSSEQTQIVKYLDEHTQKIDSTIKKETQRIELLKEYRQSLISEVVTGKIDVRGVG